MKGDQVKNLVGHLHRIKEAADAVASPESRAALLSHLDDVIGRLAAIRTKLAAQPIAGKLSEITTPLEKVIEFLESAKQDEFLTTLLSQAVQTKVGRPGRAPVQISNDLKNDEIRALLAQDLSKAELKAIAAQRGISIGKATADEVKRDILRALDRQEGYERLAAP